MVFNPTIETKIVVELLIVLVTSQLAIVSQLGKKIYPWEI